MSDSPISSRKRTPQPRRTRSRGHPGIDLRSARQLLSALAAEHGDQVFKRDEGANTLGYSSGSSGLPARKLAALVHYGLLNRRPGAFKVSPLGHQLLSSSDLPEIRRARKEAFLNPALFREIIDRYRAAGHLPRYFDHALVEEFGISEKASRDVAEIFIDSGRFAEALSQDNEILEADRASEPFEARMIADSVDSGLVEKRTAPAAAELPTELRTTNVPLDGQGRHAVLSLPKILYSQDLETLRRYLDFLEPMANEMPAEVLPFKTRQ